MHKYTQVSILSLSTLLVLATLTPAHAIDTAVPDPVKDLRIESNTDSTLTLAWTAPGDDGMSGSVSQYDMRMDTKVIDPLEALLAPIIGGEPHPLPGGETQRMTVTGLTPSTTYWFIFKSQDRSGNVSPFSNVAQGSTAFDTTAPTFVQIRIVDFSGTSARIAWESDEPATSEVNYGITGSYGLYASSNSLVKEHSLPLGNLALSTTYHYQLTSKDIFQNSTRTADMTFITPATTTASSTSPQSTVVPTPSSTEGTTKKPSPQGISSVNFSPKTLNLKSKGAWVTAVLRLPSDHRAGIDFDALRVNGKVKPALDANRAKMQNTLTRYGTLWLKFSRAEIAGLVPPDTKTFTLTLTGTVKTGPFAVSETLKVENNITKAEWERREEMKRNVFEANKQKRITALEKLIAEAMKRLAHLQSQLEKVKGETYQ